MRLCSGGHIKVLVTTVPVGGVNTLRVFVYIDLGRCTDLFPLALSGAVWQIITHWIVEEITAKQIRRLWVVGKLPHNSTQRHCIDSRNSICLGGTVLHRPVVEASSVGSRQVEIVLCVVNDVPCPPGILVQPDTRIVATNTGHCAEPWCHGWCQKHWHHRIVCRQHNKYNFKLSIIS